MSRGWPLAKLPTSKRANWVWLKITQEGLVTQVLVHVSTYQGSIVEFWFLSHSQMEVSNHQPGDQQLLKLAAGSVQHGRLPARSGAVHALHFDPSRRFHVWALAAGDFLGPQNRSKQCS